MKQVIHQYTSGLSRDRSAFTLIELLIVVAIIGILAVALVPTLTDAPSRARDTAKIATGKDLVAAVEAFQADHGRYPAGNFCIGSLDDDPGPSADETDLITNYIGGEVPTYNSTTGIEKLDICDDGTNGHFFYISENFTVDGAEGEGEDDEITVDRPYIIAMILEKERKHTGTITISEDLTVWGYALPEMR